MHSRRPNSVSKLRQQPDGLSRRPPLLKIVLVLVIVLVLGLERQVWTALIGAGGLRSLAAVI
jgi:hypothetical protein